MQLIKREFCLCVAVTALVFVCALAWGGPFIGNGSSSLSLFERAHLPQAHIQPNAAGQKAIPQGSGDCFVLKF